MVVDGRDCRGAKAAPRNDWGEGFLGLMLGPTLGPGFGLRVQAGIAVARKDVPHNESVEIFVLF